MKPNLLSAALLCTSLGLLLLCCSGCGSLVARDSASPEYYPGIYPGLRYLQDVEVEHSAEPYQFGWNQVNVPPHWPSLDFPLSFVFDTVLLPFDAVYWAVSPDEPRTARHASTNTGPSKVTGTERRSTSL